MKGFVNRLTLVLISFFFLTISNFWILAADQSCGDKKIIDAGIRKAKKLRVNPIPVCTDPKGMLVVVGGSPLTIIHFKNDEFSLENGDMLINAGTEVIKPQGITLDKGEYAIVKDNKLVKGHDILLSK